MIKVYYKINKTEIIAETIFEDIKYTHTIPVKVGGQKIYIKHILDDVNDEQSLLRQILIMTFYQK